MLFCLIFGTILLLLISYYFSEKDILSPWTIVNGVFFISEVFFIINFNKWGAYDFSIDTTLLILISLFLWGLGSVLGILTTREKTCFASRLYVQTHNRNIDSTNIQIWCLIAFGLLTLFIYFTETYKMSQAAGNTEGLALLVRYAKIAQRKYDMSVSRVAQHMFMFCKAISNICVYIFFYNISLRGFKFKECFLFIPILIYFILCALTGGRSPYIVFFAYAFVLGMTLFRKEKNSFGKDTVKLVGFAIILLFVFFIIFICLGIWGKNFDKFSIFDYLGIYTGSSIYALDKYMHNSPSPNTFWGSETLISIYAVLGKLGLPTPSLYSPRENVFFSNGYYTNVYTALRRYMQDYGFWGTYFIQLILGFFYSKLYCKIKYAPKLDFNIILYAMIAFPLVEYSIEERFFLKVFSLSMFYEIVYTWVLYAVIFKFRIRKNMLYRTSKLRNR